MTADGEGTPDVDPQCPFLIQRIEELESHLAAERDPALAKNNRRQLRALTQRARNLGCFCTVAARVSADSTVD